MWHDVPISGKFLKVSFGFVLFFGQNCLPMSWPLNTELIGPSHHGSVTPFSNIPLSILSEYFKGTFQKRKSDQHVSVTLHSSLSAADSLR